MRKPASLREALLALSMVLALASTATSAQGAEQHMGKEAGLGVGAVAASLVYSPAKLIYAGGGALVAGLAWMFSGGEAGIVQPILNASVRGDYVVTPDHLTGRRRLEFVGRPPGYRRLADEAF